jgi:hypothetical protein
VTGGTVPLVHSLTRRCEVTIGKVPFKYMLRAAGPRIDKKTIRTVPLVTLGHLFSVPIQTSPKIITTPPTICAAQIGSLKNKAPATVAAAGTK